MYESTLPFAAKDTEEALWKDPDWVCPNCKTVNMAIRGVCRSCGFDSEVTHAGV